MTRAEGYDTPQEAALANAAGSSGVHVIIAAACEHMAGVVIDAPGWPSPDFVWCSFDDGRWFEAGSGSGHTQWTGDEDGIGVLASWGQAEPGVRGYEVTFLGIRSYAEVSNGHWIWLVEGVREGQIDAPATLVALRS